MEWKFARVDRAARMFGSTAIAFATIALAGNGATGIAQEATPPMEATAEAGESQNSDKSDTARETAEEQKKTAQEAQYQHSLAMATLHNQYRAQSGLPAQSVDTSLSSVAQRWAEHMAATGSMYHGGGEQIIAMSGGDRSYNAGFRLWLGSSPHRAWLCSRGDRCGFGYAVGRNGCAYYAGAFASSATTGQGGNYHYAGYSGERRYRQNRRR